MDAFNESWVSVDGEFVRGRDATVSVLDRSYLYGDGIFEGIGITENRIVLLDEHVDRLYRSAKRVRIEIPIEPAEMRSRIVETARRNGMESGYLRPLVSRGSGPLGIHNTDELEGPTVTIIPQPDRHPTFGEFDAVGVSISSVRQSSPVNNDPRVKSNNYLPNILAALERREYDTAILLDDDGDVTEAAGSNLFVVTDGELKTPPKQDILVGTTRNAVLEVADSEGIPTSHEQLTPYDLYTADEMFLTSSLVGLSPVVEVEDTPVGDGEIGEVTRLLGPALEAYLVETGAPVE